MRQPINRTLSGSDLLVSRRTIIGASGGTLNQQLACGPHRLAFAVLDARTGEVIGSSSYHDIVPAVERLEIGYTWYAKSRQHTHVNASAKLLLMTHAFETLGAKLVGWRTDNYNFASQKAIERLGARKDGVIRHHALRRDGTVRDTVMYSVTAGEWPEIRAHLRYLLSKPRARS